MTYESKYERFEAKGPDGTAHPVEFIRAGFLAAGDQPELYFFRVAGVETAVGISGNALRRFEQGRPRLTREQKIDLTGEMLRRQIEAGATLDSKHLFVRGELLAQLAGELGFGK